MSRRLKRIASMEERNRRVDDAAYRAKKSAEFAAMMLSREVRDFIVAYEDAYKATEMTNEYLTSAAGVYFPIQSPVYMQSSQEILLELYNLFVLDPAGNGVIPILTPFDWPRNVLIYSYHPPDAPYMPNDAGEPRYRALM